MSLELEKRNSVSQARYSRSNMMHCDDTLIQAKRIKQIKFVLNERMKEEFKHRLDVIAGREIVNILETKRGAIYMMPPKLSKSEATEIHKLH